MIQARLPYCSCDKKWACGGGGVLLFLKTNDLVIDVKAKFNYTPTFFLTKRRFDCLWKALDFHSDYRFEYIKFNFGLINNNS